MIVLPPLKWLSSPNYSSRGGQRVRLLVTHSCEGSYLGSQNWFSQARSQVSAHLILKEDGSEAVQMVAFGNKAWSCCALNSVSESYEMAGYENKGFSEGALTALADIVAYRLHINGLPPRFAEKGVGEGMCRHLDLGAAGGNHKDWTLSDDVWNAFVGRVQHVYAQPMPGSWPIAGHVLPPAAPPGFTPSGDNRSDEPEGSLSWVQARLNALGARPHLIVDGLEGPMTERAIVQFQETHHLFVDGVAGPVTCKALAA